MAFNGTPHVGRMFPAAGLTPSSTRRADPVDLEARPPVVPNLRSETPNDRAENHPNCRRVMFRVVVGC
jgi:hypothetical protein